MKQRLSVTVNGQPKGNDIKSVISTVATSKGWNQISVDFMTGTGHNYKEVDNAQISIWFTEKDGPKKDIWTGSFDQLKALLFPEKFAVIYDEDRDGIATTERQLFDTEKDGEAYYNKQISEGSKEVILASVKYMYQQ